MIANPFLMLFFLVILLGCSAFFSGSETALMSISKLRLKNLEKTHPGKVKIIERVLHNPEKLIGTILLGNNLVNVAMSALATTLALSVWGEKGIVYVTLFLTFAILIFAEITPKVYAKYFHEKVSLHSAPILRFFMIIFRPLVEGVTVISTKLLFLIGVDVKKIKRPLFTETEVMSCINLAWDDGGISTNERRILSRVFTLNDKTVDNVMVQKEEMIILDVRSSLRLVVKTILKTGYTRFPVSEGEGMNIIGFLHAKDVLSLFNRKREGKINSIIRPPYFIPADRTIDAQLRHFQAKKLHQAVVLDKEGIVTGLITLEDILEELVGTIKDEHDII